MSKVCAKCSKSVYPLEELKCLDKIWHKICFKCTECGMILNMKNYKGFDKKPYCTAHYPHTKATVVADTPEMARIAQNTKLQSQVKYHEEFEKTIKGSKIEVVDDPESRRIKRLGSLVSDIEYKGTTARRQSVPHTSASSGIVEEKIHRPSHYKEHVALAHSTMFTGTAAKAETLVAARRIGSIADYDPLNENYGSLTHGYHPASRSSSQSQEWEETITLSPQPTPVTPPVFHNTDAVTDVASDVETAAAGVTDDTTTSHDVDVAENIDVVTSERIADNKDQKVDNSGPQEENDTSSGAVDNGAVDCGTVDSGVVDSGTVDCGTVDSGTVDSGVVDSGTVDSGTVDSGTVDSGTVDSGTVDSGTVDSGTVDSGVVEAVVDAAGEAVSSQQQEEEEELPVVVSKQSIDARSELVDSLPQNGTIDINGHQQTTPVTTEHTDVENESETTTNKQKTMGPVFQAVYEYEAQDDDEVSFVEGDEIVEVQVIDEGWMFGKVVRTGKSGMLPSNYIEPLIASQQLE